MRKKRVSFRHDGRISPGRPRITRGRRTQLDVTGDQLGASTSRQRRHRGVTGGQLGASTSQQRNHRQLRARQDYSLPVMHVRLQ